MYWSVWLNGAIQYAWMDGTHKEDLIKSTLERPINRPASLVIDFMERKLYWCDVSNNRVNRIGLDGKDYENLLLQKVLNEERSFFPRSIAYHNQYLFWTDQYLGSLARIHLNSTEIIVDNS